jgi:hypothetical protein
MEISQNLKDIHKHLSENSIRFLEFVEKNSDSLKRSNFSLLELNDEIFNLQPWPTFINQYTRKEMIEAGIKLCDLIKSIPGRLFDNNPHKMSQYYELPADVLEKQMIGCNAVNIDNALARGDFAFSSSGWKCLEYNVTAHLGGWQVPLWESLYLNHPIISRFFKENKPKIMNENLISILFAHMIENVLKNFTASNAEINIALVIPEEDFLKSHLDKIGLYMNQLYARERKRIDDRLKGELRVCSYSQLEVFDHYVYYKNKMIHCILELHHGEDVPEEIMRTFALGNVLFYNGPITNLLSNKLNLALLSENPDSHYFSHEEKELIRKYVPWSRKIIPGYTTFGSEKVDLENFIRKNRENLVIKPAEGYGGMGVYIGRNTTREQWEECLETAIKEKHWLVQEHVELSSYLYQAGDEGCTLHDAVWGFFIFGPKYAGEWVRVLPKKDNKGVINCHQGASVSVIFEVEE